MLTLSRQNIISSIQRLATRCISTVVPEPKIEDFGIKNEPILDYLPGSEERRALECALKETASKCEDIPIIIGGEEFRTKDVRYQVMPHNHSKKIAKFYYATPDLIKKAIDTSAKAQKCWDSVPLRERIDIYHKAADMMSSEYRQKLNAATMLGQAKITIQAEIDSSAELIDFMRFNAYFAKEATKYQPISEDPSVTLNSMRYRGLEGFVAAISPFNFSAIGGNLAYAPALMGCSTLWKPSDTAILSNYTIFKIMTEAGMPSGVVNFVPADGPVFGSAITQSPHLAGINFTGSVPTFNWLWTEVGKNINKYINFPRLIGECGGKNYHFIHPSADVTTAVNSTIRSAFEYSGQKCSACSRAYIAESIWNKMKPKMLEVRDQLKVGDVTEYDTFMSAVIDKAAFKRIKGYIEHAKKSDKLEIIGGGKCDDSKGYFVEPTIVITKDPYEKIFREEIFGPVLSIFVYKDKDLDEALELIGKSTPFALTGAVYAQDREFLESALEKLKDTAGNFYINDKSTGAVVGQQPFGGARMSGTNDKAGGPHYVLRWASPQSIKETFVPTDSWSYPYMKN